MTKINIKPLSVNKARQWKRFKTKSYKDYEKILLLILPKKMNIYKKMELRILWAFSSPLSDTTNPIKLFEDILSKKYDFNDRDVWRVIMEKKIVPKWSEYIQFQINEFSSYLQRNENKSNK